MVLKLGNDDVSNLLKENGWKVARNQMDGENAERTTGNATMIRDYIASKYTFTATFRDLTDAQALRVFEGTDSEWIVATYRRPGGVVTGVVYCTTTPATLTYSVDGEALWTGIEIQLVER